ncbi:MAG: hypothetical protein R3Y24_10745, partial [Eubacteriales bacterium]
DNWTVIDYEWTFEKIIETKEIVFRSIYCYLLENEKRNRMNFDFIMEELGITEEDIETYREHELTFQKHVTGKRLSMPEIRNVIGYKMFAPEKWITKFEQAEGKERVQIYEDRGNGFSEEQSYFVKDAYMSESMVTCTIEVSGDVQCVRIDPMMDSCIVKVKKLTFNGVSVPLSKRKIFYTNGKTTATSGLEEGAETVSIMFGTTDPNIYIQTKELSPKSENVLHAMLEVVKIPQDMATDVENEMKRKIRL